MVYSTFEVSGVHEDESCQGEIVAFSPKIGGLDITHARGQARQSSSEALVDHGWTVIDHVHGRRESRFKEPCGVSAGPTTQIEPRTPGVVPEEVQEDLIMGKFCLDVHSRGIRFGLCRVKSPWPRAVCQSSHLKGSSCAVVFSRSRRVTAY